MMNSKELVCSLSTLNLEGELVSRMLAERVVRQPLSQSALEREPLALFRSGLRIGTKPLKLKSKRVVERRSHEGATAVTGRNDDWQVERADVVGKDGVHVPTDVLAFGPC